MHNQRVKKANNVLVICTKWTHIWHRRAKARFSKKTLDQGDTVVA